MACPSFPHHVASRSCAYPGVSGTLNALELKQSKHSWPAVERVFFTLIRWDLFHPNHMYRSGGYHQRQAMVMSRAQFNRKVITTYFACFLNFSHVATL